MLIALLEPIDDYEPRKLREAMKVFGKNLEKDIEGECNGNLGRILRSLASAGRSTSHKIDQSLAKKEAQELYDAGEGKFGTDESEFIRILCTRPFPQLNATFEEYRKISKNDIEKAIKKEMSGDLEKACLAIVKACRNRPGYYAE
ncbi:unnamed protein product [Brachionus calyciflorus]|uniref:Annexin n=1 Tax=Brachionus calyciflorus TaxID=104777 RepID=A0A814MDF7_9BILA|nr:unnamed protein product [Brachionus calyciflorus]